MYPSPSTKVEGVFPLWYVLRKLKHSVILAASSLSMTQPCQWMLKVLKVQGHERYGMLDLVMLEKDPHWLNKAWCWISSTEFKLWTLGHSPINSLLPIAFPQSSGTTAISWCSRWAGKQRQSLLGHCMHAVRQGQSDSGCVWGYVGQQAVCLSGKFIARGHPGWRRPWKGDVIVSLNVSSSWGELNSQM